MGNTACFLFSFLYLHKHNYQYSVNIDNWKPTLRIHRPTKLREVYDSKLNHNITNLILHISCVYEIKKICGVSHITLFDTHIRSMFFFIMKRNKRKVLASNEQYLSIKMIFCRPDILFN